MCTVSYIIKALNVCSKLIMIDFCALDRYRSMLRLLSDKKLVDPRLVKDDGGFFVYDVQCECTRYDYMATK